MSATNTDPAGSGADPSEQELREAYEREIKRIRVEHVLLDNLVTLINLGMRRTGMAPGTEGERDPAQVKLAIDAVRAHMPLVEEVAADQVAPLRQALSQLQLAYVRIAPGGEGAGAPGPGAAPGAAAAGGAGGGPGEAGPAEPEIKPGEPGPAQRSGRLWVPGQ